MRNRRQIRERGPVAANTRPVIAAVVALSVLALAFFAGLKVGRREARLGTSCRDEGLLSSALADDSIEKQDYTFYTSLNEPLPTTAKSMASLPAPAPAPAPALALAPAKRHRAAEKTPKKKAATATPRANEPADTALTPRTGTSRPARRALGSGLANEPWQDGPASRGEYTVQVSSFQSREEARAFVSSLRRRSYRPFIVSSRIAGKGTWHRVRIGRFAQQHEAQAAKWALARADIPAWVLRTE